MLINFFYKNNQNFLCCFCCSFFVFTGHIQISENQIASTFSFNLNAHFLTHMKLNINKKKTQKSTFFLYSKLFTSLKNAQNFMNFSKVHLSS